MTDQVALLPSTAALPVNLQGEADRRADTRTLWLAAVLIGVSLMTQGFTEVTEAARAGLSLSARHVWTLEATSHGVILALVPLLIPVLNRAPLAAATWRWSVPVHGLACVAFSLLHVALMWAARLTLFPPVVGYAYDFDLLAPENLAYEFTKDVFTYALLVCGFLANRVIERRGAEARAARAADTAAGRLTLFSGGTTIVLAARDVSHAKAAENYVEIHAGGKPHLVRMTLVKLEALLRAHGNAHARVHRSYLVNLGCVRAITPTGEGDVSIELIDGSVVPGSRRYRENLKAITT
ncbi:MAG: LytTR family DNA-binding domain-containing protein [Rhodospirillaceae bacterium]|nr:LytTR family DNA-binding domain-containing protein [Rhodospirillaceae bacterium]